MRPIFEDEEVECPECGYIKPADGPVSDPNFEPEEGYEYKEYVCLTCTTVLLTVRKRR